HAATVKMGVAAVSAWHAPLIALSTGNVVVFWLFTRALFDDGFVPRAWHALIWLAVAAFSFVNCMWIAPAGHAQLAITAVNLLALAFIGLAIGQMIPSWSADLVESRRRVRIFIVGAVALYGGLNAILQISGLTGEAAAIATVANTGMLALVVAAITTAMIRVAPAE